jgi:hypothetical protein
VRERWVRLYLGFYLRLVEDDRCSILENSPMSHHFTTQEEELFNIGVASFKCLATSSIKVSKVGLRMLPLSGLDPLLPEFPPFMIDVLEVVNSPADSPKYVRIENE